MLVDDKRKIINHRKTILTLSIVFNIGFSCYLMANEYPKRFKTQRPQSEKDRVLKVIQSIDPASEYFMHEVEKFLSSRVFGHEDITYRYQLNRHLESLMLKSRKIKKYYVNKQVKLPGAIVINDLSYFFMIRDFEKFFQTHTKYVDEICFGDIEKTKKEMDKLLLAYPFTSVFEMNEAMQKMYQSKGTADSIIATKVQSIKNSPLGVGKPYVTKDFDGIKGLYRSAEKENDHERMEFFKKFIISQYLFKQLFPNKNPKISVRYFGSPSYILNDYFNVGGDLSTYKLAQEIVDLMIPEIIGEKNYWIFDKKYSKIANDRPIYSTIWGVMQDMIGICATISGDYDSARQVIKSSEEANRYSRADAKARHPGYAVYAKFHEIPR